MRIANNIHLLKIPFKIPVTPEIQIDRFVNIYIIEGEELCLIDTGVAGCETIIGSYLESIGRKISEISAVLLTHTHPDHIGALQEIKKISDCKIYVHPSEKAWLEDTNLQYNERPVPGFHNLVSGPCKADVLVTDEIIFNPAPGITMKAIHCPGHSAGSVAYLYQQENALFCGDIIPVKGDIPIYDSYTDSIKSLEKLENAPYPQYLLSAWDLPQTGEDVDIAISNGFEVFYTIHAAVIEAKKEILTTDLNALAAYVLQKNSFPAKFINPLFLRALKSHL